MPTGKFKIKYRFSKSEKGVVFSNEYHTYLNSLRPGEYYCTIAKYRERDEMSRNQLAYYYGVILPIIAEAIGDDDIDALDSDLKANLASYIDPHTGMLKVIRKTEMTAEESNAYIDKVIRWASQFLGVSIPSPNQAEY